MDNEELFQKKIEDYVREKRHDVPEQILKIIRKCLQI